MSEAVTREPPTDCWDDTSISIERRLRAHGSFTVGGSQWRPDPICAEAADEIERLRAEVALWRDRYEAERHDHEATINAMNEALRD